jgi:ABC-type Zn uptake system ZnuABC Zn-binding protein ZnuA
LKINTLICLALLMLPSMSQANNSDSKHAIIVTLPPLSGVVQLLLPEVQSQCLLSVGADPHHFQPSPRQVDSLNQGHTLIRASRDDQGWPISTKQSQLIDLWSNESHAWLQFKSVSQALPKLASSLIKAFPQHKSIIEARLPLALKTVGAIEKEWHQTLRLIKDKGVFMQHPSWFGLLEQESIPVWSVLELNQHGHEQGPRHLEEALQLLKAHPDALLLGSNRHSNRSLEWLNKHHNSSHPLIKLDALGACNQPWDELMRSNLKLLRERL